ncbi:protein of unknown function [Pseudomonas sp. JV551A1]|nr:protein of unknown function [Pseudomonas sp. JV551A1]
MQLSRLVFMSQSHECREHFSPQAAFLLVSAIHKGELWVDFCRSLHHHGY